MTKTEARAHLQTVRTGRASDLTTTRRLISAINGRIRVLREFEIPGKNADPKLVEELIDLQELSEQLQKEVI